jgi:hypothetical protein
MSPSVRVACYPDGDSSFLSHTTLILRIDLPETYSGDEVVLELERRLRETYPLAQIHVESGVGSPGVEQQGVGLPTWHIYRDGVAAHA